MPTQYPIGFVPDESTPPDIVTQMPAGFVSDAKPTYETGGLGFPVSDPELRQTIAAKRLVQSNRATGLNNVFTREEINDLAKKAGVSGIPENVPGHAFTTNQFANTPLGTVLQSVVTSRAIANQMAFGVPGAVERVAEDFVLSPEKKAILGSQAMAERAPEQHEFGNLAGSVFPSGLVGKGIATGGAGIIPRVIKGAQIGGPIGMTQAAAGEIEENGTNANLNDLIKKSSTGLAAGTAIGGGTAGLVELPGSIKSFGARKSSGMNEAIMKAVQEVEDSQSKLNSLNNQIKRGGEIADLERQRLQEAAKSEEAQRHLQEVLEQEKLKGLEGQSTTARSEALQKEEELGPKITRLVEASKEQPKLVAEIQLGKPRAAQPAEFGGAVTSSIESEYQKAKKLTNKDYTAIKEALPESQPKMEASNLHEVATELKKEQAQGLASISDRELRSVLGEVSAVKAKDVLSAQARDIYERLPPDQQEEFLRQSGKIIEEKKPQYTWDNMQAIFQQFNDRLHNAIKNEDGPAIRTYSMLRDALNKDMEAYAEQSGTEAKKLFDQARANYVAREEKFGTSRIQPLISDTIKEKPNLLLGKVVTENNAPVINNLREILPPEQFQQVQSQFVQHLFSPAKDVPFDASHFVKQFENVNDETLQAAFGKEGFNTLKKLHQVSKGADSIGGLQKSLEEYNSKAQKADEAFQSAKTKAEENRIMRSLKSESQQALDAFDQKIQEIKEAGVDEKTQRTLFEMERNLQDARAKLDKVKNPAQISIPSRIVLGLGTAATAYYMHHPVLGILAGTGAFMTGEKIGRNIVTPVGLKLLDKAASSKADSQAIRDLSAYLSQQSVRTADNELNK